MSPFLIIVGLFTMLIGAAIWYDDKEIQRLAELEEMEREHSPELYDDEEDTEFQERWGSFAPAAAFIAAAFYTLRGLFVIFGGAWLTVTGIG